MKQCKFFDIENEKHQGGILLDDGSVICGCCGNILPADERDKTWNLEEVYEDWVSLSDEIVGW